MCRLPRAAVGTPEMRGFFPTKGAEMKRGLTIAGAALLALAIRIVVCSSNSVSGPTPLHAALLRCNAGTATSGSLTVTSTCNGITSSGHTASITLTAAGGAPFHVMSSNQSSVSVAQGATANQFMAKAVAAGAATVHVTDSQGDDVSENEQVDDVGETPEPAESESPEPVESESPEPGESESPEPTPTGT